jgi:hypothetical protein
VTHSRIIASLGKTQKPLLIPISLAVLSISWKAFLLGRGVFPFNADEAIVGLMAKHILQGNWPTFFYGQAYMGSLDATLVAVVFRLFGASVGGIRLVQVLLYAAIVFTTAVLARSIYGSRQTGNVAGLLLVFPTVNVVLYSTVSLGGYGESILLGNLLLILTLFIVKNSDTNKHYLIWGVLAGLGFWAFGLTLIYIIPGFYFLLRFGMPKPRWPALVGIAAGFLVGSLPWWVWALQNGPALVVQELLGSAIAGASAQNPVAAMGTHILNLALFGSTVIFGFRAPWSVELIAKPLIPLVALIWVAFAAHQILTWRTQRGRGRLLVFGVVAVLLLGFVLTPFGADPSGRYFAPLTILLAVPMANFLAEVRSRFGDISWLAAVILLLTFNAWGTLESAGRNPPGITTQFNQITQIDHRYMPELKDFLSQQGETVGYTNYWVSYPLAFLSNENLIFIPRLPYHLDLRYTARDDRYTPYSELVDQGSQIAYITTRHADLDAKLRDAFTAHDITWEEKVIGEYRVFYSLSALIAPDALVLIEQ